MQLLEDFTKLKVIKLTFPGKTYKRYIWGNPSTYQIIQSLNTNGYFSHLSALSFHKLMDVKIHEIYFNIEQSPKPKFGGQMIQENIDKAFSRKPRTTTNIVNYQKKNIIILNGMHTKNLGVKNLVGPRKEKIMVTNIERTMIDIIVRPHYSGGVSNILRVYKKAMKEASVKIISKMLKKLDYSYPYHQSIGFFIEKAGFKEEAKVFKKYFKINYDFYLCHEMNETEFCEEWRIHYPKNLVT